MQACPTGQQTGKLPAEHFRGVGQQQSSQKQLPPVHEALKLELVHWLSAVGTLQPA